MKKSILLLCLFVILLGISNSYAQVKFETFDEDLGYCSHSYHIIQDDYGFLWSATLTGLVKTDGYSYTKFNNDREDTSTIASNFSTYLFEDRFSNIWVNNYEYGISIYDRSLDRFRRIKKGGPENLQSSFITSMIEFQDSIIFIAGDAGLEKVIVNKDNYSKLEFIHFPILKKQKVRNKNTNHIWDITHLTNDKLLVSSQMGFFVFDIKTGTFSSSNDIEWLPKGQGFSTWYDEERNQIWFAESGKYLTRLDQASGAKQTVKEVTIESGETYLYPLNDTILLLKQNGFGLSTINLSTLGSTNYSPGINSKINHLDRWSRRFSTSVDGSVFIGSNDASRFSHIPSIKKSIYSISLLDKKINNTSCIYEDEDFFLASFNNNGLYVKNKKSGMIENYRQDNSALEDDLIMHVDRLSDGRFLIMARPHAYLFYPQKKAFEILSTALFFRNGEELKDGRLCLFSGGGAPMKMFTKNSSGKYVKLNLPEPIQKIRNVRALIEEENGSIWMISANDGLFLLNQDLSIIQQWQADENDTNSLVGNGLESMFLDDKQRLWIGSLVGLSLFDIDNATFSNYTLKDGLDDSSISDIIQDEDGQIWISSFDGLYQFDEETKLLNRMAKSSTINQNFAQRGLFKYQDKIYAAGTEGIDVIEQEKGERNNIPPLVQLTNIFDKLGNSRGKCNLEILNKLVFSAEEKQSKLEFAALHFGAVMENQLQYRLRSNDDWTDISNSRLVDLANVEYGRYTLQLRGSNAHGYWSNPKSYQLLLNKPWFKRYWFYGLLLLSTILILYAMYMWKLRQMAIIQKKQRAIDQQIAEIELKALKAQMNPHFVFNSLNSVKALILEDKRSQAIEYLTSFSNLIRKILNNSNDKFIRLQDELQTIRLYLQLESLRFDDAFSYDIKIDSSVNVDFVEVPALILQPYVENAIWHGLLHKSEGDKSLLIDIKSIEKEIEIIIEDNGIGRTAASLIKTRSSSKTKSMGLAITGQRVNYLKQLYGNNARVQVVDLEDLDNNPIGTRVIIRFQVMD